MTHPRSDHCDGRSFFNPNGAGGQPFWKVPAMLFEFARRTPWPSHVPVAQRRPPVVSGDEVAVTFIGHASFLIQTRDANVLVDPVYSERASPLSFTGPRRVRAPGVRFEDLPPISHVLLSHNHYDHCDVKALAEVERCSQPVFITPLGNGALLRSIGAKRVHELDWWESADEGPMSVVVTPAQHFSARGPFDRNRALWGGFLIAAGRRRILFAGDSGYGPHFKEIGARLAPFDLALLPIGAYDPRWFMKDIHMNPAEAVEAHLDLGRPPSIAMHFGTFQLTTEGIDEPVRDLGHALRERGVADHQFRTLEIGDVARL